MKFNVKRLIAVLFLFAVLFIAFLKFPSSSPADSCQKQCSPRPYKVVNDINWEKNKGARRSSWVPAQCVCL